jgi:hypothetical protein
MTAPRYEYHPLALRFPPMTYMQRIELVEDIRARGLLEPITLYENQILDGRNRYEACIEADVPPRFVQFAGGNPIAFVWSKNGARRHLSEAKRLELAKTFARLLLINDPDQSDRQVAEAVGISHPTVAKIREEAERTGDVETLSTRRDTKGRPQPAHKPPPTAENPAVELPRPSLMEAVSDLINFIVSGFDSIQGALRNLSETQQHELREGLRRAQARLAAIASLVAASARPETATKTPPAGDRCATCGAAGELFGYRDPGGGMTWFCAEHRKAKYYADAHTKPKGE